MITRTSLTTVLYHREIPYADTSLCIGEQFGYREKRPIERSREDKKTAFRRRRGDARPSVSAISLPDRRIAFICVNIYIQARLTCALETRERKTESERERERERGGGVIEDAGSRFQRNSRRSRRDFSASTAFDGRFSASCRTNGCTVRTTRNFLHGNQVPSDELQVPSDR